MDREELRKNAKSRRQSADIEDTKIVWNCTYCQRPFQTETGFMNHKCKGRERLDELRSPVGQQAYSLYAEWMRVRKMTVPPIENFMESRYFRAFVKFSEYANKTAIPNVLQYVKFMVEQKIDPMLWTNRAMYASYLEWFDDAFPPESQFIESLDRLLMMVADHKVEPKDIFKALGTEKIVNMVRRRKLTPWLLVTSSAFLKWASALDPHERSVLTDCVDVGAYSLKLQKRADLATMFRKATNEVGL